MTSIATSSSWFMFTNSFFFNLVGHEWFGIDVPNSAVYNLWSLKRKPDLSMSRSCLIIKLCISITYWFLVKSSLWPQAKQSINNNYWSQQTFLWLLKPSCMGAKTTNRKCMGRWRKLYLIRHWKYEFWSIHEKVTW